ncbi:hypothetical protein Rhe02_05760 [Rhizocola hellebori]|uniref:Fibronectin type-III domain-containing protein n=1 Tax=Rhizocola hellebori TaxID=1392758 RepID=A0A8J3Q2Y3_9ACTN|nr:fibronectin type III domain-containing protein [Rhizocola hellebori]GIH02509.1 hypothetical protein Rhe02_05760 [Rhizocola hellebori]
MNRLAPFLAAFVLIFTSAESCDPNHPPAGGTMTVSAVGTPCADSDLTCYRPFQITVDGRGFTSGSRLKVFLPPSDQTAEFTGFVVGGLPLTVGADGTFHVQARVNKCRTVTRPLGLRPSLFVVADDLSGTRQAFAFAPTSTVICQPPYAVLERTGPCNPTILCPRMTNDNATTVGLHWQPPSVHNGFYRMRYWVADDEAHYTEHTFGGDVRDVAVHNLSPNTTYAFTMQNCTEAPLFGKDSCAQWQTVGVAAPS